MLLLVPLLLALAMEGPSAVDTPDPDIARDNAEVAARVAERIKGHEDEPAGTVFRNIQLEWFKSAPAGVFLEIMRDGYAAALGVRCTHCHVEGDFASDDKRPKLAAREMAVLHKAINDQLLAMRHLENDGPDRFINCSTCHRGKTDPHE